MRIAFNAALGAGLVLVFAVGTARADDGAPPQGISSEGAPPDRPVTAQNPERTQIDRTWLYADDARVAAPMTFVAMTNASYTNVGPSPTRIVSPYPNTYNSFASNTAQPGGMVSAGGELGLLPRLSVMALGEVGFGGMESGVSGGAIAGLRVSLLPTSLHNLHLVASGGYLREAWQGPVFNDDTGKWSGGSPHGDNGAWVQVAISGDIQRLRLAGTVHGEHVFADGRDPLDLMIETGASYRLVGGLRAGVEYVGQDLEESFSPGAEGGARHFVGPNVSLQLWDQRFTAVAGPAFGLNELSPRVLARAAIAYAF